MKHIRRLRHLCSIFLSVILMSMIKVPDLLLYDVWIHFVCYTLCEFVLLLTGCNWFINGAANAANSSYLCMTVQCYMIFEACINFTGMNVSQNGFQFWNQLFSYVKSSNSSYTANSYLVRWNLGFFISPRIKIIRCFHDTKGHSFLWKKYEFKTKRDTLQT